MRNDYSERYSERSARLSHTFWGRIYRKLHVHPTRFYGDLQHKGIINWHHRVESFVNSFPSEAILIDLGSGSRRIAKNVLAMDIKFTPTMDIAGDGNRIPFSMH
jgi:hypothetical protein